MKYNNIKEIIEIVFYFWPLILLVAFIAGKIVTYGF